VIRGLSCVLALEGTPKCKKKKKANGKGMEQHEATTATVSGMHKHPWPCFRMLPYVLELCFLGYQMMVSPDSVYHQLILYINALFSCILHGYRIAIAML
jgi:hypothetical protein